MEKFLGKFTPYFYALLRMVAGVMFALHGAQKLFGFPDGTEPMPLVSLIGLAGIIEFAGGLLMCIGLFTRYAAFIASGTMAVAYFMGHAPKGWSPLANQGELAVLYCFLFLYIAAQGAGIWSLDKSLNRTNR